MAIKINTPLNRLHSKDNAVSTENALNVCPEGVEFKAQSDEKKWRPYRL
jgi:hypothetical protein